MRLRPIPIEISVDKPFDSDLLKRRTTADSLTELVASSADGLVLSLHAPWGHGKTTFLRMWRQQLLNEGFKSLYFNAWETDFANDALVALIGELEVGLNELGNGSTSQQFGKINKSINVIKKVGAKLIRRSLPVAVKVATAGALDLDEFTEEALAGLGEKLAEDRIANYEESRKSLQAFRDAVAQAARDVLSADKSEPERPLLLIIDELDRCRPDYAIRILECIKHLFSVPGVVFVLAIDKAQLAHAVRSLYGVNMDATGYLRRFFDIELTLPEPDESLFLKEQFSRFGLTQTFEERASGRVSAYDRSNLEEIFPILFRSLNCSLREIERAFTLLAFALKSTPKDRLLYPDLLATLIVLKIKDSDLYASFVGGSSSPEALVKRIAAGPGGVAFMSSRAGRLLEALLEASVCPQHATNPLFEKYERQSNDKHPEVKKRAVEILEFLRYGEMRQTFGCKDYLVAKIDLVSEQR